MIVVLITGGREYGDANHVWATLDACRAHYGEIIVVQGGATGADYWAREWAKTRGVHCATVPALWTTYNKGAGKIRNGAMLFLNPSICIAFPGGNGTADMKRQARAKGVPVYEV